MLAAYLAVLDTHEDKMRFKKLYHMYEQDMFKTSYSILKNRYDSEDAVHISFANILRHFEKITEVNSPRTHAYLIIVARNAALKLLAERNSMIPLEDDVSDIPDDFDLEDHVISNTEAERLKSILEALPGEHYEILFLSAYMGLSISEIADILNITYEAAKKRLWRARKKFKELKDRAEVKTENAE